MLFTIPIPHLFKVQEYEKTPCCGLHLHINYLSYWTASNLHGGQPHTTCCNTTSHHQNLSVCSTHTEHLSMPKTRATGGDGLHPILTCRARINGVKRGQHLSAVLLAALLLLLAPKEDGQAFRACNGLPNPWLLLFSSYVHHLWTSPISSSSASQNLTTVISYLDGSSVAGLCCEYRSSHQPKWTTWMLSDAKWWD